MRKQEYRNHDSGLSDSPEGVRQLNLEVSLFSQYPLALKSSRHDSSIDPQAYYMSAVEFVNAFRVYHALLSIIDTAFKKLRVRQTGETDSPDHI